MFEVDKISWNDKKTKSLKLFAFVLQSAIL